MGKIDTIIFDLGGVIINLDNNLTEKAFVDLGAKDFHHYFGHGFAASFFKDYEVGKINDRQFIDNLKSLIKIDVPDYTIIKAWNALLLDFPAKRIKLLNELRKKYRLFLFSNTNSLHMEEVGKIYKETFNDGELNDHFEKAYYSHLLKMRKPDKEAFEFIIRENNLTAPSTLFVDDAMINVEGANAAGLKGFFLKPGKDITNIEWNDL
ncbi:MAG: HAD family phosphatase [Bacteroidetes bacterium]|nr:HAD family phosphatase [Bacteroidota bacterium]